MRAAIARANAEPDKPRRIELRAEGSHFLGRCDESGDLGGDLDLHRTAPTTIVGVGRDVRIAQQCPGERVLEQHGSGTLRLVDVTLRDGSLAGTAGGEALQGGALRANGDVQLERVIITHNSLRGADAADATSAGQSVQGGGLYVAGSLTALDSALLSNSATAGAGAASSGQSPGTAGGDAEGGAAYVVGDVALERVTLSANVVRAGSTSAKVPAGDAIGGGIAARGSATAREVTAVENTATAGSNALLDTGGAATPGAARGGAISATTVALTNGSFTSNSIESGSGLYTCATRTLLGWVGCAGAAPGAATGSAVWGATSLAIQGGQYAQNIARAGFGGAATSANIPGYPSVQIPYVPARAEGAAASGGSLTAEGSEFRANRADHVPAPPYWPFGSSGEVAAALGAATSLTITATKIDGNTGAPAVTAGDHLQIQATEVTGSPIGLRAESISASAVTIANSASYSIDASGAVSLVNSTLVNNGNGIKATSLELLHSTITDDTDRQFFVDTLTARGSYVAAARVQLCASTVDVVSAYNWFGDESCQLAGPGDRQDGSDALLGPLASNGGSVRTRLPAAVSGLVDAIPSGACAAEADARGVARPQGAACDIGAVELSPVPGAGAADLAVAFQNPPASFSSGAPLHLEVRLENRGPGASAPTLFVEVPAGVTLTSLSAGQNGTCTLGAAPVCTWSAGLPSGTSAIITMDANTSSELTGVVPIRVRAVAREVTGSTADDQAELSLTAALRSGLRVKTVAAGFGVDCLYPCASVSVQLVNEGPSVAVASPEVPITVRFDPEPGVTTWTYGSVELDVRFDHTAPIAPGETAYLGVFAVRPASATESRLGTLRIEPGPNQIAGPAEIPAILSNISVAVRREPGIKLAGAPGSFTFEVTNDGSAVERDVVVNASTNFTDSAQPFTFTVEAGTVEGYTPAASEFEWHIPSIAPGQTLRLKGNARHLYGIGTYVSATVYARAFEIETWNNGGYVDYGFTPLGTADLRVSSLNVTGAGSSQVVIEATVENLGPQAATSSTADPIVVSALADGISVSSVIAEGSSGWTCTVLGCSPAATMPVGARASFRFVLDDPYPDPLRQFGASVRSVSTPDHAPSNNRAFARPAP